MNRIIKNIMLAGALLFAVASFSSCSDTWNDHYEASADLNYDGTLMGFIDSQAELSDFAQILRATGFDIELNSEQVLTVMAPKNGTFDKAQYLALIEQGDKDIVIDEFVKNHVCRYNVSVGDTVQKVTLLNTKNIVVGTLSQMTIDNFGVAKANVSCKNGVVHILNASMPYQYNIYEYLGKDYRENWSEFAAEHEDCESWYGYLKELYVDSLDESRSVSRGVDENGDNIWVDSVTISNNRILRRLDAYLYREDSTYLTLLPSYEAYNNRYKGIYSLFNWNVSYNSDEVARDSISRYYAHYFAMCDLSYNMSESMNGTNFSTTQDSLYSSLFSRSTWPYYVYYNPTHEGGILSQVKENFKCSNGQVAKIDNYPFPVFTNVFKQIDLQAERRNYVYEDADNAFTNQTTTTYENKTNTADSISGSGYLLVSPATSNRNTEITFQIPNTLSGQYDIYIKFLPPQVADTTKAMLPLQFRASIYERNETNGNYPAETRPTYEFLNGTSKNFQTKGTEIDSIYVGTYKFNYCYLNTTPGVLFKLESYVLTSQAKKYTKEMLIDKICFIPNREAHDADGAYVGLSESTRRRK